MAYLIRRFERGIAVVDMRVPYGGSFTSSLLAASLRKQIDDRLTFSHRLIAFIAVARTVLQTEVHCCTHFSVGTEQIIRNYLKILKIK